MNINLETQLSTQKAANTDINITTTYQPHTSIDEVQKGGYTLDIADKVTDNEVYQGQGLAAQEFMQQAGNLNTRAQKDFMIVMSGFVSGEDLQKMQEEGFNPGSVDVETYVSIVDEIKVTLAKSGVEIAGYNDNLDADMVKEVTGSQLDANELSSNLPNLLEERDLPVTDENIAALKDAAAQAADITELSDDAIKYMVTNQKAPTVENIYKAQFSSVSDIRQAQGYYSEGAGSYGKYYSKKADSINWDNLKGQIETIVKQAGLDIDEQTKAAAVENAKWLVESGIELNAKNLTLVSDLKSIKLPMAADKIYELCADAMGNGKAPTAALMTGEYPIAWQAQSIIDTVEGISDEAVHDAVESGVEINIKNLAAAQAQIGETPANMPQKELSEPSLKEIETRRQLEEARLMMSVEANKQLIRKGIAIDTTELSRIVEELKAAEQNIKAAMFKGGTAEENDIRAAIYQETTTKLKELGGMPAALAVKVAANAKAYTIPALHSEGRALQEAAENQSSQEGSDSGRQQKNAAAAYETLMTVPRKDLGDRISKAFRNVDDILKDMGIEPTDANRRAVRILGYNTMEITEENINAVKAADSKVCGIITRMTPAVTLKMIREQKNPLGMTLDELDDYLNEQDKDLTSDAERFSRFLQKLDRSGAVTEDEREAYIGVYRMFRQIEKTDGAVIGSIVMTGAEMNFKNMLSAIRSSAGKDINLKIDDSFGGLEALITKGKAIDAQIMAGFNSGAESDGNAYGDNQNAMAQEKYYARLSGEINDELADRTDVDRLRTISITADTTIEAFADSLKMTQMSENQAELKERQAQALKDFHQDMQRTRQIDDDIIQSLIDYGQPVSVDNIQAAEMLMADRGSLFRQIFGRTDKNDAENGGQALEDDEALETSASLEDEVVDISDRFVEKLTDKANAQEGYRELISGAEKAVENIVNHSTAQLDIKAAQSLYKGLSLAGSLAREENYEIPVNIKGEITSVNLKIYHNSARAGKVAITLETGQLGRVAAEFDVKQGKISGMIAYENAQEDSELSQLEQSIKDELSSNSDMQAQISLIHSKTVDLKRFGSDRDASVSAADSDSADKVATSELYRTAKAFMMAVKSL